MVMTGQRPVPFKVFTLGARPRGWVPSYFLWTVCYSQDTMVPLGEHPQAPYLLVTHQELVRQVLLWLIFWDLWPLEPPT